MAKTAADPDAGTEERTTLELQRLRHEIQKLALEIDALRSSRRWERLVGRHLPIVTALLAIGGFWVGIFQYYATSRDAQQQRAIESRREAARPFWDTQLRLYVRAAEAAATIATSNDGAATDRAEVEFWTLYWGPLAIVEDASLAQGPRAAVEDAMVALGAYLRSHPKAARSKDELARLSLRLAHAMREQTGPSFSLELAPLGERSAPGASTPR